jgi:hypothetical protein
VLLFTTNHCSVRAYREKQGKITPVLEDLDAESGYVTAADDIQGAEFQFARRYLRTSGDLPLSILKAVKFFRRSQD